jgi:hypothetical protein
MVRHSISPPVIGVAAAPIVRRMVRLGVKSGPSRVS